MNATADAIFGPQLRGSFDFTLLFEQAILSISPSALFLVASPVRVAILSCGKPEFKVSTTLWIKLIPVFFLFGLQLANLTLWSVPSAPRTRVSVAATTLSLVDVLAVGALLWAEHRYSHSPSTLLSLYLSTTLLFDVAITRSLFLRKDLTAISVLAAATVAVKLLILALEEIPKRGHSLSRVSKEVSSGWWNRSVFWWLNSTFRKGFKSFIRVDDLSSVDYQLSSHHLARKLDQAWKSVNKNGKYCLAIATFTAFQTSFWAAVIPRLCYTGFTYAQPFLINTIVTTLGDEDSLGSRGIVGGLIGATALVYFGIAFSKCHYMHHTFRLITAIRGGLVSLIFTKVIDLDAVTAKESAAVTLMSTDIDGIASGLQKIHDIWASIIELAIGIYLLERQIGSACFIILVPAALSSFATGRAARGMGPARMAWNSKVQKRVSTTSATLNQIKGVKMMGLSDRIATLVQSLRVVELESSKTFRMFFVWINIIANLSDQLTPIVIIAAAVFWTSANQDLSVATAFTSLSIITLVSTPLVNIIAAYPTFVGGVACFQRIQAFLLSKERQDYRSITATSSAHVSPGGSISKRDARSKDIDLEHMRKVGFQHNKSGGIPAVQFQDVTISLKDGNDAVLRAVNLHIPQSSLTMLVGPVGSGKSTLLKAILGEVKLLSGLIKVSCGPIAYCDQSAWLRLGSIRDNILGPNIFDETWYRQVLHACALDEDLTQLEDGDKSLVGSGGIALSGGQKQRVALARAVYAKASLVLFDDVFSSLDNKTSQDIFSRLLGAGGIMRRGDTTIVLATHAVKYLPSADSIFLLGADSPSIQQLSYESLRQNASYVKALAFGEADAPSNTSKEKNGTSIPGKHKITSASSPSVTDVTRKTGDLSLYRFYLASVGVPMFIGWLIFAAAYIFSGKIPQIWLRIWTENGTVHHSAAYFGGYLGFGLLCALMSGICVYYYMIIVVPKSAQSLHRLLLDAVLKAPLWFFTTTDTSTILNRFSQDMTLVDQVLPMAMFTTTFDVYNVIAGTAIIASGASYVAVIIPFCMMAIHLIQKFYLRTSRQMRHLDLEAKSPLYRLFTETADGAVTIRAFGWQQALTTENLQQLDFSQKPYYMMYCIQRWLNVVLDIFVAAIAIILVGLALGLPGTATQGSIGLALLNVMEFNSSLSMLVNSWTGLETSLGAIARLKTFLAETKAEGSEDENDTPPPEWPDRGSVQLHAVTAKYNIGDAQSQPALRDVTLELRPGQNILIVGRTGSGKSSLLLTLLRLLDLESGRITIDGLDLSRMSRQALRARIVTIPQDPVQVPGTVRYNLTQFEAAEVGPDEDERVAERALARVGLWGVVSERGGLGGDIEALGLSGGQKQLFSLARAILSVWRGRRKSKGGIVLLDEPTSSVDEATEVSMRGIMSEEFVGYTVITVSHRMNMAADADVVVHMADGKIIKVDRKDEDEVGK